MLRFALYLQRSRRYCRRMTVGSALDALVSKIVRDNPGLEPGAHTDVSANGLTGHSVECNSPSGNSGKREHDWIFAFPQKDGSLRYFVFAAPTTDSEKLRLTFAKMLQRVRLN